MTINLTKTNNVQWLQVRTLYSIVPYTYSIRIHQFDLYVRILSYLKPIVILVVLVYTRVYYYINEIHSRGGKYMFLFSVSKSTRFVQCTEQVCVLNGLIMYVQRRIIHVVI